MEGTIRFFRPNKTLSVSVTGSKCSLNCVHCGGHFLESMIDIKKVENECSKRNISSCLISGGCNRNGKVPFEAFLPEIKRLKDAYRINMHTGMLDESDINLIVKLTDVVSIDIPASDKVIKDVYGLDYKRKDYFDLLEKAKEKLEVVPHLCLGLDETNSFDSELEVMIQLSRLDINKVCIIIFTPVINTLLEKKKPPEIHNLIKFFESSRKEMAGKEIYVGCMRPGGAYRDEIDSALIDIGIDGIVMPSKIAVKKAKEKGLNIIWIDECCAF